MNIKDHIEAGHYPKDEKGRALVPTPEGHAVIAATDAPGLWPLQGWRVSLTGGSSQASWHEDGETGSISIGTQTLLPPPPRKVKVSAWGWVDAAGTLKSLHFTKANLRHDGLHGYNVELTGEYEEPWS